MNVFLIFVIIFSLCGTSPFFVEGTPVMMQKIIELCYDFNHPDFHQVSPEAKDFVIMMLKRNPTYVIIIL